MMRMRRWAALTLMAMLPWGASLAHAVDVPRTTPPPDTVDIAEPHRFSPILQGAVGATTAVVAAVGLALFADSFPRYDQDRGGGDGMSCRPCSSSQYAGVRGEYYAGIALLSVGAVLGITTGVLAGLDRTYRREHQGQRTNVSRVSLTATGLRF